VHSDRILGVRLIAEEGYVVCSEEETQTLAWQVDSPLRQCRCTWNVNKSSWVPG
jgi:hypothetical protein